jgi:hypothetical protein
VGEKKMADKKNILLLFEKPGEPVFTPKGWQKNCLFGNF